MRETPGRIFISFLWKPKNMDGWEKPERISISFEWEFNEEYVLGEEGDPREDVRQLWIRIGYGICTWWRSQSPDRIFIGFEWELKGICVREEGGSEEEIHHLWMKNGKCSWEEGDPSEDTHRFRVRTEWGICTLGGGRRQRGYTSALDKNWMRYTYCWGKDSTYMILIYLDVF